MIKINQVKIILVFVFLSFFCWENFSQTQKKLDSILVLISNCKSDSAKLKHYKALCEICPVEENIKYGSLGIKFTEQLIKSGSGELTKKQILNSKIYFLEIENYFHTEKRNYFEQIQLNQFMIQIGKELNDTLKTEEKYVELARILQKAGKTRDAFDTLSTRIKLFEKNNAIIHAYYLRNIGEFYYQIGKNEKSLEYFLPAYSTYIQLNKLSIASDVLLRISEQYNLIGLNNKSIEKCKENLKLIEKTKDYQTEGYIFQRMFSTYMAMNDFQNAELMIEKLKACAEKNNESGFIGLSYWCMAQLYGAKKNTEKEKEFLLKSIKFYESVNDKNNLQYRLINLGIFYLDNYQFKDAIVSSKKGLELSRELKDIYSQRDFLNLLYLSYKKFNKFDQALKAHEEYQSAIDSIQSLENHKSIETKESELLFEKKQTKLQEEQLQKDLITKKESEKQIVIRNSLLIGLVLIAIFIGFILKNYRQKQKSNVLLQEQNETIRTQKSEVEIQKHFIEEKQKEILDSLQYAKRIQNAILARPEEINKQLPENFLLYRPKDIVAGDFYFFEVTPTHIFYAAADCTGHGVPGAMLSVVCANALTRSVREFKLYEPGKILDKTRDLVLETFAKSAEDVKDGMDISLISIEKNNRKFAWSGANNPLWLVKEGKLTEVKADKQPIGKSENPSPFTTHFFDDLGPVTIYLFTDGYADQFGGPKGKKFKYKQLEEICIANSDKSMAEQQRIFSKKFEDWKKEIEQIDDVCLIGFRI